MKTVYFGEQPPAGFVAAVMDGGTHGVPGHTIAVASDGTGRWERRVDSMAASGERGSGVLELEAAEWTRLRAWLDVAWELAGGERARFFGPISAGPPRWVWAVAMRRAEVVRVVEGGTPGSRDGPQELAPLLEWLRAKCKP